MSADTKPSPKAIASLRPWLFAVVPAVGLLELGAHGWQTTHVVSEADWSAARSIVAAKIKPDDLILFAPRWAEPLGRRYFGAQLATMDRMTYADESRYSRVVEVSIRGGHRSELDGWKVAGVENAGRIAVTTFENPSPAPVVDEMLAPPRMHVSRVDARGEQECALQHGPPQTSGTYFPPGVPIPGDRWSCAGGYVAITVMPVLDYTARRCVWVTPQPGTKVRGRFGSVKMGRVVHGSHGLYAEAERDRTGAPVTLELRAGDELLGAVVHKDGDGWKSFELPTTDWTGQTVDVVADVSSSGHDRQYCFEVSTR